MPHGAPSNPGDLTTLGWRKVPGGDPICSSTGKVEHRLGTGHAVPIPSGAGAVARMRWLSKHPWSSLAGMDTNDLRVQADLHEQGQYNIDPDLGPESAESLAPTAPADDVQRIYVREMTKVRAGCCLEESECPRHEGYSDGLTTGLTIRLSSCRWPEPHKAHPTKAGWCSGVPAPTTPADDLPPGVERISDGTLWAMPHAVIPDDYEARSATGGWGDPNINRSPNRRAYPCEVRPITPAAPATEWVPWWEAFNDELPLVRWGGQLIKSVQRQGGGVYLSTWGLFPVIRVEDDAKVEVQR